jgi:ribosomal protein L10
MASRGTKRAEEAKGLHGMTREFMEDMRKDNRDLSRTILAVKNALISLTETLDEILPHIKGITNVQLLELRRANRAAKLAAYAQLPDTN